LPGRLRRINHKKAKLSRTCSPDERSDIRE
jgi:hypothetical protein